MQKGRRTQWFLWKYWVTLTRNCNTPLLKTTDHGYHSNPCVVPHSVTLAPVCDTVSMRTRDFHKGSSSHQNMRIIIYYANQTWVNREGFWWGFQQGKIQLMSMCILSTVDEKPCPQLQNGLYLRILKGQIRHILIWPSNFSFHWMWSVKTSFQRMVYCGWGFATETVWS